MYVYINIYIYIIYGFLVCLYARSLGLTARQNTPAIEGAFYRPNGTLYQLQPFSYTFDGTGADGPRSEGGTRPPWRDRQYRELKKILFRPPVRVPLISLDH